MLQQVPTQDLEDNTLAQSVLKEKVIQYNLELSEFMRRHQETAETIDLAFHHEEISKSLLYSIMSMAVESPESTLGGVRHYQSSFMDLAPIKIIDRTDGAFLEDPDLNFVAIYTSPPAEINIVLNPSKHRAEGLSRAYPVIGNQEHMDKHIYGSDFPVNEETESLLETIMSDPNMESVRNFPVSIVGAGEVGSWAMILMTMTGMEKLSFYEMEDARLTAKHMGKMPYLAGDQGMRKSQLMLQKLFRMNPMTKAEYRGGMSKAQLEGLNGSKLILSAMDNTAVMADLHEYAFNNQIDLLLTTDIGKGAMAQLFRYSTGEVEILHGLVSPEELRRAQDVRDGKVEPVKDEKSPILKMLGMHRVITQFDLETVKSFLYGSQLGHFGYLPQDPSAAMVAASLTNTVIWKLATGQQVQGNTFFLDPDVETNRNKFSRFVQYVNNALQSEIFKRLGMIKDVKRRVELRDNASLES